MLLTEVTSKRQGFDLENIDFEGNFGLERETLRVDKNNRLAQSPHPFKEDCFARDFAENQLEIVTPVCKSTDELMKKLEELDKQAREILDKKGESLWLCSNPPYFESEDEIPVANYTGEQAHRTQYRKYLEERYGKRLMLYSGIHFNFSFKGEVDNEKYFKLFKYLNMYSYLLVLLMSASPVFDGSLIGKSGQCFDGYASRRNGKKGYWNKFIPILDYSNVLSYVSSVNRYIDRGKLYSCAELYMPIRIKAKDGSDDFSALVSDGINHIELRMFDVNPLSPLGIMKEDLDFAHYLILYLLQKEDFDYSPIKQRNAIRKHKKAALYNPPKYIVKQGIEVLNDMKLYFRNYPRVCKNIDYQLDKLQNENRYCIRILKKYKKLN